MHCCHGNQFISECWANNHDLGEEKACFLRFRIDTAFLVKIWNQKPKITPCDKFQLNPSKNKETMKTFYFFSCYDIKMTIMTSCFRFRDDAIKFFLRLLTHVQVSVRCLFKDDQFSLLVWFLLSLLLLCFHIQKQLILHALAINPSVLIELHLGISNMHHLIVGQVGIKIITSITGGEKSNPL